MKSLVAVSALLAFTGLVTMAPPAWAAGDDVVLLNNGGRVRGTVVQEDPAQGVRIRLLDGTFRNIATKDVQKVQYADAPAAVEAPAAPVAPTAAPPPPAGAGSIHVETTAPGTVTVDGGLVGKAPADVSAAAVGRHRVHVDFDDGGSKDQIILVQGGQTASVKIDLPETRLIYESHTGFHIGFGLDTALILPAFHHEDASPLFGAGVAFVAAYGISPGADLRMTAFFDGLGGGSRLLLFGGSVGLRFNLGSTYTMAIGARVGVASLAAPSEDGTVLPAQTAPFFAPELSLIGFRFGDQRQFSIELTQRVGLYVLPGGLYAYFGDENGYGGLSPAFENVVTFNYLFLGAPPGAARAGGP